MGNRPRIELVACSDCSRGVSFTAVSCPNCGSTRFLGPYLHNARERRLFDIERRNDRRLLWITIACCATGVAYGVIAAPGPWWAALDGLGFGLAGMLVGIPTGFAFNFVVNVARMWPARTK